MTVDLFFLYCVCCVVAIEIEVISDVWSCDACSILKETLCAWLYDCRGVACVSVTFKQSMVI